MKEIRESAQWLAVFATINRPKLPAGSVGFALAFINPRSYVLNLALETILKKHVSFLQGFHVRSGKLFCTVPETDNIA